MKLLYILDILSELIQLVFDFGTLCRRYLVPACVYLFVVIDYFIKPALTIPYYYFKVREERLATV